MPNGAVLLYQLLFKVKRNSMRTMHRSRYFLLGIAILAMLGIVFSLVLNAELHRQNVAAEAPSDVNTVQWGTLKDVSLNEMTLDPITHLRHYQVTMTVNNISDSSVEFSPGMQVFITSETGMPSAATAKFLAPETVTGGSIAPGKNWHGTLDFEYPDDSEPVKVVVEKDASSRVIEEKF